jgi:hypothetical protein
MPCDAAALFAFAEDMWKCYSEDATVLNRREEEEDCTHRARSREAIPHRGRYAPYEWWHRIEMRELNNDITNVSSKALRLRGASPQGCKAGSYQCCWCEPTKRNNNTTAHCVSLTRAVHGSS